MAWLTGKRVSLRPPLVEDAEKWAEWLSDPAVAIPLGSEAYQVITVDGARRQIQEIDVNSGHEFTVVCHEAATGMAPAVGETVNRKEETEAVLGEVVEVPIGRCLLFDVDLVNRTAMLGIFIGEKTFWGRGLGTEALRLLLDYAFDLLNLNSVMLGAYAFNERAIRCYRNLGFTEIGRRRQYRLIGGTYYDGVLMDLLVSEYTSTLAQRYLVG